MEIRYFQMFILFKTVKQMIQCHWAKKTKPCTSQLQMSSFLTAPLLILL